MKTQDNIVINDKPKNLGAMGEKYIANILEAREYSIYRSNFKKWGFEIDLIVYKFNLQTQQLEVRAVEVKTRSNYTSNTIDEFHMEQKIRRYRYFMFNIGEEIHRLLVARGYVQEEDKVYYKYHLDLAIVGYDGVCYLHKYIQNVNLLM
jgi:Holliday junction resolvase-like predicted endonuclease